MRSVLELLENTAARLPDATAFIAGEEKITFSELISSARRTAAALSGVETVRRPVAVITRRDVCTLRAFFGALWAGGFYVPLDADMPKERMRDMLAEIGAAAVLCSGKDAEAAREAAPGTPVVAVDGTVSDGDNALWREIIDTDPAYMIFTSGSTGKPKGILVSHRCVLDFIDWYARVTGVTEKDRLGNQAPFFFDLSVKDVYLTLKTGAATYIIPKKCFSFPVLLIKELDGAGITTLSWSTAAFRLAANSGVLDKYAPATVKRVLIGGEAMQAKHLNAWRRALPDAKFYNLYGPTETTVDCTFYPIEREFEDGEPVPIGRACENKQIILLANDREAAPGEPGEICVRGSGVAIGYYRDPERTAKSFMQNPLNRDYPDIIYRTGDVGYVGEDGNIYYLSRKDGQIKHNGYRIELGEIETALCALQGVLEAVCVFDGENDRVVAAYRGGAEIPDICRALKERLPRYMIPEEFRPVDKMPQLPNGKTDRVRLKKELLS